MRRVSFGPAEGDRPYARRCLVRGWPAPIRRRYSRRRAEPEFIPRMNSPAAPSSAAGPPPTAPHPRHPPPQRSTNRAGGAKRFGSPQSSRLRMVNAASQRGAVARQLSRPSIGQRSSVSWRLKSGTARRAPHGQIRSRPVDRLTIPGGVTLAVRRRGACAASHGARMRLQAHPRSHLRPTHPITPPAAPGLSFRTRITGTRSAR
jgi:hypothetical protein